MDIPLPFSKAVEQFSNQSQKEQQPQQIETNPKK